MSISSVVAIKVAVSGDEAWQIEYDAAENTSSPAQNEIRTLANGNNTITPPSGGSTPKGVLIVPPTGNTNTITVKGTTGDTGILLHPTNPTQLAIGSTTATFVLAVSSTTTGVRFIWS